MAQRLKIEPKKSQDNIRKLIAERKKKNLSETKINNPLAKYDKTGQLLCILCSSVVRSEDVWLVHVNSKKHKENIEQAKKLKDLTDNFTLINKKKRSSTSNENGPQEKKLKSILKHSNPATSILPKAPNNGPVILPFHNEEIKRTPLNILKKEKEIVSKSQTESDVKEENTVAQVAVDQPIPEGFFDDPILDAKVRNIEYKDPVEEEWEKFQKEIKEVASASADIIAGEQEEATAERQIDEIDEQIRNWSRVLDLEVKKEEAKINKQQLDQMDEDEINESEEESDIDEFLDWRSKKS